MERIIIEYNGFIEVDKNDLKVQRIDEDGNMVDVDTSKMSAAEVVAELKGGNLFMKSFGETYANDALDGGDDFTFDFEEEDEF